MIGGVSHTYVWVEDYDRALAFYTGKLGFEVREDATLGGRRWVTVGHPDQPALRLVLRLVGPPLDDTAAAQVRELLGSGSLIGGGLVTDDCRAAFAELSGRGVRFLVEPAERPYGIEAVFLDDSGNAWGLVEPR
ncbi:MAG TPA: VOC family protein [Micromonosporaceae bacterium]|jgi:catechol 2,3-dioxygenase-like lactoylglutathione lyase family enzyme